MSQSMREEYKGEQLKGLGEDWSVIERLLPVGWQAQELRALFLTKGSFKDAGMLLGVMLMHLSGGCSLRETAARAQAGGLVSVSEVALLKRLRGVVSVAGDAIEPALKGYGVTDAAWQTHSFSRCQCGV